MVNGPQEVAAHLEEILHNAVNRREVLHAGGRFEAPHLGFSLTGRLVGDLRPVVLVLPGAMHH